jgi:hypothetical protein
MISIFRERKGTAQLKADPLQADPGAFAAVLCIDLADLANSGAKICTWLREFVRLRQCSQALTYRRPERAGNLRQHATSSHGIRRGTTASRPQIQVSSGHRASARA